MDYAGTVLYVDDVPPVLDFYRRAFGFATKFTDLDVQLPGRRPEASYQFALLDLPGTPIHLATHALGEMLMPDYERSESGGPAGVEIAFYTDDVPAAFERAVAAGAMVVKEPTEMPWGQTAAYVRSVEGTFVGLVTPMQR